MKKVLSFATVIVFLIGFLVSCTPETTPDETAKLYETIDIDTIEIDPTATDKDETTTGGNKGDN